MFFTERVEGLSALLTEDHREAYLHPQTLLLTLAARIERLSEEWTIPKENTRIQKLAAVGAADLCLIGRGGEDRIRRALGEERLIPRC